MRIESLSIRSVTIGVFVLMGVVAVVLSMAAGEYFQRSALNAQVNSLSRVLEVAAQEMQQRLRTHSFDFGMKMAHSRSLVDAFKRALVSGPDDRLVELLDDPFINGFVGFSQINLVKLRLYASDRTYIGESSRGLQGLAQAMPAQMADMIAKRPREDRLKTVDALWLSSHGPLHSSLVPLGGLRPVGYLEVVLDPAFNLTDIAGITRTPIRIYSMSGELVSAAGQEEDTDYLAIEYVLETTDGQPAYRVVGLEHVALLKSEMAHIKTITVSVFIALAFLTLLLALWLFNRFMLSPVDAMAGSMRRMAEGRLDMKVPDRALREFHVLADTFNGMADQVRLRTNDLERLLDLDDSGILCFDQDLELVYFNRASLALFGYGAEEISDLDPGDLFAENIGGLIAYMTSGAERQRKQLLTCHHRDGHEFRCECVINPLDVMGQRGHAIALNALVSIEEPPGGRSEQRLAAVEQSLTNLLAFAQNNPSLMLGAGTPGSPVGMAEESEKAGIREQAVGVMNLALKSWEHELGRSKLDLAEQSGIWPVYIDKSTPTTRTLDRYLSLEHCPKNPRSKRVVATAEFVLRQLTDTNSEAHQLLLAALNEFRDQVAGLKPAGQGQSRTGQG